MLNEKDARHESLKRIADTLRISVDDLYGFGEDFIKFEQTDRMMQLWEHLTTDRLREDALDAIQGLIQHKT
ncbi:MULTISPECIES: hypothetical protein [unclassified Methylobacterium]|uniref:hypothetical protein n=1 Tax=unclassified Methylobacterium TaxID=2615210 RepID=UPI0011C1D360|nr:MULTISPECIES: hypothetical protein [unclassified Methylobacterium]QEE41591.1 hypothetical protein FVA80_24240 [Methylobacterium sp. WL1]TXN57227.1 hypothetical protein FV241_11980 [Methylobacterium sp. WL2]